jgi:protein-S-isoprenylcysteine O-methyltransferase Ste14
MEIAPKQEAPRWAQKLHALQLFLSRDFLGGPRVLKMSWVVNSQKGLTLFFVLGLMYLFDNFSTAAWIYLGLHGSYGFCWLLKHLAFRDRNWETKVTFGGAFMMYALALGLYWVFPFMLISGAWGAPTSAPSNSLLGVCIGLHTLGVAIMLSADCQKYFTLKYRSGLITEGMFSRIRHPNYLGEMMIYASYALLVRHWIPWVILAWVWFGIFLPNMKMKEVSLSRYSGWAAYKARTGMLFPVGNH